MHRWYLSVPLSISIALGFAAGCASGSEAPPPPPPQEGQSALPRVDQSQIADTTLKLEMIFSKQFEAGQIDRGALAQPIKDVLQAMPEEARAKVQHHIDQVIDSGEKLAAQLPPAERKKLTAAPSGTEDEAGHLRLYIASGWGYPYGAVGWGGYGAFGFPGMYYGGYGYPGIGYGYATGYASGYATGYAGYGGYGYGGYGYGGCGAYAMGCGGWYW
jgi:hypothetical protein